MTAVDLMLWSLALIVFVAALGAVAAITVLATRFLEQQRANLAAHRALKASQAAADRAAEQRAELEAADILEQRLALPLGGGTTSRAELIQTRLDQVDGVIKETKETNRALARQLATLSSRVDQLQTCARITHTDRPLQPGEGQR